MKAIRRFLLILLVFVLSFNNSILVYAVPNEDDDELEEELTEEEELALKIENIENYRFNIDLFEHMVDVLMNPGEDYFFEGYTQDADIESNVPHTALEAVYTPGGQKIVMYNSDFTKVNYFVNFNLYSDYIKGGRFKWRTVSGGGSVLDFGLDNMFVYARDPKGEALGSKKAVGVDSYGNIVSSDRHVLVPFFLNRYFVEDIVEYDGEPAALVPFPFSDEMIQRLTEAGGRAGIFEKDSGYIRAVYVDRTGKLKLVTLDSPQHEVKEDGSIHVEDLALWLRHNQDLIDVNKTAEYIKENFASAVEDFNNYFMDIAIEVLESGEGKLAYLGVTDYGNVDVSTGDVVEKPDNFLAEWLSTLAKEGAGAFIKLTFAYLLTEVYEELFINFASKYIFYTSSYEDSLIYQNLIYAYFVLVIMFLALYLILNIFVIRRGISGDIFFKTFLIILICVIPILSYPKLINVAFNKAPASVTEKQVKNIFLLDRWAMLSEINQEELNKVLPFTLSREIRTTSYNYLVEFNTDTFVFENLHRYKLRGLTEEEFYKTKSQIPAQRIKVYVDANHLIDYMKSGVEEGLFTYLAGTYPEQYYGADLYSEYALYPDNDYVRDRGRYISLYDLLDTEYFGSEKVSASQIGVALYRYYEENTDLNIFERFNALGEFIENPEISSDRKTSIVALLSDIPREGIRESYEAVIEDDFSNELEYNAFVGEKNLVELCNYGDILGMYDFLKQITLVKDDDDPKVRVIRDMTIKINEYVMNEYIDNIRFVQNIKGYSTYDESTFAEATQDVIVFNAFMNILKQFGCEFFPQGMDMSKVETDVFMRALTIPYKEMTPSGGGGINGAAVHAALYIGAYKSLFTALIFLTMIVVVTAYGLIKLFTVSWLLLPLLVVLFLYNYAIKGDYESKVWFGALYIIGIFALVHLGFVGLWYICSVLMNSALVDFGGSGRVSFFGTFTNCLIISIYFVFVILKVIKPTLQTAVKNIRDLGGSIFWDKASGVINTFMAKTGLSNIRSNVSKQSASKKSGENPDDITQNTPRKSILNDTVRASKNTKIEDEINSRVATTEELNTDVKDSHGGIDFSGYGVSSSVINPDADYDNLIANGVLTAKLSRGLDKSSSVLKFKTPSMARSVEDYLRSKGYETHLDGKNLHVNASGSELIAMKSGIEKSMQNGIETIKKAQKGTPFKSTGETVANTNIRKSYATLPYDDNALSVLQKAIDDGKIEGSLDIIEDSSGKVIQYGYTVPRDLDIAKRILLDSGNRFDFADAGYEITLNNNPATKTVLESMKLNNKIPGYTEDNDKFVVRLPNSKGVEELVNDIETLSLEVNKADNLGLNPNKRLSFDLDYSSIVNLDSLKAQLSNRGLSYGEDYTIAGNTLYTLSDKGYRGVSAILNPIDVKAKSFMDSAKSLKDLDTTFTINPSDKFVSDDVFSYTIDKANYSNEEILNAVSEILQSDPSTLDAGSLNVKNILTSDKITLRNADGNVVILADTSIDSNEILNLVKDIERYIMLKNMAKSEPKKDFRSNSIGDRK